MTKAEAEMMTGLDIAFSGAVANSFDGQMKGFYTGAIVIDSIISRLPSHVKVSFHGHTWAGIDSEMTDNLIRSMYSGINLIIEERPDFQSLVPASLTRVIDEDVRFPRVTVTSLLSFSYSRSKAATLLGEGKRLGDTNSALLTRWDIGYRGGRLVNTPVSLNKMSPSKVNYARYRDSSYGAADMWFYGSKRNLYHFHKLYDRYCEMINLLGQQVGCVSDFSFGHVDSLMGKIIKKIRNLLRLWPTRIIKNLFFLLDYIYNYSVFIKAAEFNRPLEIFDINNHFLHSDFLQSTYKNSWLSEVCFESYRTEIVSQSNFLNGQQITLITYRNISEYPCGLQSSVQLLSERSWSTGEVPIPLKERGGFVLCDHSSLPLNLNFSLSFLNVLCEYIKFNRNTRVYLDTLDWNVQCREHPHLPGCFYIEAGGEENRAYIEKSGIKRSEITVLLCVRPGLIELGESMYSFYGTLIQS